MEKTTVCPQCGESFTYTVRKGAKRKYCSLDCQRKATQNRHNSRAKERIAEHNHKGYFSKEIISLYGAKCAICGWRATEQLITTPKGIQYAFGNEIHHITPVNEGGKSNFSNLILLCPNHHKQADLGIIDRETLQGYLKEPPTEKEKQALSDTATARVTAAIMKELK